jgi:hypothetical protein
VGGAFSLGEVFGETNTQRETQDVEFPEGASRKRTTTFIVVRFPESLLSHSHTDVYNSKVNTATTTRRSNDESETVATTAKFNDDDYNIYR